MLALLRPHVATDQSGRNFLTRVVVGPANSVRAKSATGLKEVLTHELVEIEFKAAF